MIFRTTLKNWLALLANWAVRKHKIKLVIVSGWYGTEMTRELVYSVIGTKERVRRITKNPWWDFSIPLAILGYKDERRSFLGWLLLLFKSKLLLFFGRSNPHTLVLNLNYADADTIKYWSKFVRPEILLIANMREITPLLKQMLSNTIDNNGVIIHQYKDDLSGYIKDYKKVLTIGSEPQADLTYKRDAEQDINFTFQEKSYRIRKDAMPGVKSEVLAGCLAVAINQDIKPLDALYAMVKYPGSSKMLSKLKLDLFS